MFNIHRLLVGSTSSSALLSRACRNRTVVTQRHPRAFIARSSIREMHVRSIPMWTGTGDNYSYVVTDDATKEGVVIDPANPPEVLPVLSKLVSDGSLKLKAIINTHHHRDHAGGNKELRKEYPDIPIIGGKDCDMVKKTPKDGEEWKIGANITVRAIHTPCHTQDSICYYMSDGNDKVLFTGDTLFIGGCGRFFEGDAEQMHKALNEKLASLPDSTKVYPGHEYTKANAKFASSVYSSDALTKLVNFCNENKETQGKFTIGDEKNHNVFMRIHDPEIHKKIGESSPHAVMQKLRDLKNSF